MGGFERRQNITKYRYPILLPWFAESCNRSDSAPIVLLVRFGFTAASRSDMVGTPDPAGLRRSEVSSFSYIVTKNPLALSACALPTPSHTLTIVQYHCRPHTMDIFSCYVDVMPYAPWIYSSFIVSVYSCMSLWLSYLITGGRTLAERGATQHCVLR